MCSSNNKFVGSFLAPPFSRKRWNASPASSTVGCKSVFTTGADDAVLSFCARQAKNRLAGGALAVNVSFSVSELVFLQAKEITEFFVLASALCYVFRKHTVTNKEHERQGHCVNGEIYPQSIKRRNKDVKNE